MRTLEWAMILLEKKNVQTDKFAYIIFNDWQDWTPKVEDQKAISVGKEIFSEADCRLCGEAEGLHVSEPIVTHSDLFSCI